MKWKKLNTHPALVRTCMYAWKKRSTPVVHYVDNGSTLCKMEKGSRTLHYYIARPDKKHRDCKLCVEIAYPHRARLTVATKPDLLPPSEDESPPWD